MAATASATVSCSSSSSSSVDCPSSSSSCGQSNYPIRYANGEIRREFQDLSSNGFNQAWGQNRSYNQQLTGTLDGYQSRNGDNWFAKDIPHVVVINEGQATEQVCVMGMGSDPLWFDLVSGSYVARHFIQETLEHDTTNNLYILRNPSGQVFKFFDGNNGLKKFQFYSFIDPGAHETTTTSSSTGTDSFVTKFEFVSGIHSSTYRYDYYGAGDPNAGRMQYATYQRNGTDVRRASYAYYGSSENNGSLGDLKTVKIERWNGTSWDTSSPLKTTYYRYYKAGDTNGFAHALKYVVGPEAYARMVAVPITPETASDAQIADYADHYFEYDSTNRWVTREKVNGGAYTHDYSYTTSSHSDDYNKWKRKTVETLPAGNQNIVYTNYAGQEMLKIFNRVSDSAKWYEFYKYDSKGRVLWRAESSAIDTSGGAIDDSKADLLDSVGGNYQKMYDSAGLIRVYEYYSSTDIPNGAVAGYLRYEKIKKGETGSEILQREFKYTSRTAGGTTIYPLSKEIVYLTDTDQTNPANQAVTEYTYNSWITNSVQVEKRTTTLPAVSTGQNGSGTAATREEVFDEYGFLNWVKDERGVITRFKYDLSTGALTQRIDDVDTDLVTDEPTGWSSPNGLHLISDFEIDDQGRTTQELGPQHDVDIAGTNTTIRRAGWFVYKDDVREQREAEGYFKVSNSTYTLIEPIRVTKFDRAGRITEQIVSTRDTGVSGKLTATEDLATQSRWVRWRKYNYDNSNRFTWERVYHLIPSSGEGVSGTNYTETLYGYDAAKRRNKLTSPGGTIARTVFHARGWPLERWTGTNDTGATDSNPGGSGAPNNMVKVEANEYDSNSIGKDGVLTKLTRYENASTTRVTTYAPDWRNRRINVTGEENFYEEYILDNLDRATQTDRKNGSGGSLIARSETKYDSRGRVYQEKHYSVSGGVAGNSLTNNFSYDAAENLIKHQNAGSGQSVFDKMVYDGLARVTKQYVVYDTNDSAYSEASSVSDDIVMQQAENTYDPAGNVIKQITRERFHNATDTSKVGELTSPSGADPKARVSYRAFWPDALGRAQAEADYGTNGGTDLTRPATAPASSDTVLVTKTEYNNRGEANKTTNPKGQETRQEFDHAARLTKRIENYVDGTPAGDNDRTTEYVYHSNGQIKTLTVKSSSPGDHVTKYVYGTVVGTSDSDVASNELLRAVIYPDSDDTDSPLGNGADSTYDRVEFQYNRLGEKKWMKDQLGTIHKYYYDKLGRLQHDAIDTLGSGVDGAIRRISRTYEPTGSPELISSYDNADPALGTVKNQVKLKYNGFGLLTHDYQAHTGAVSEASSPKVQYAYADGSANHTRPTSLTYPDSRVLTNYYETTSSHDDILNRITQLKQGTTVFAAYTYLGLSQIVVVDYQQPDIKYNLITGAGADPYDGMDRFGRVVDALWQFYGTPNADRERVKYGFDRAGNRLWRENTVATSGQGALYAYDGLYRVTDLKRGDLNANKDAITGLQFEQQWTLDQTDNWSNLKQDNDGNGTWDLDQARTHLKGNEIEKIDNSTTYISHNLVGNMTKAPKLTSWSAAYDFTYDAWNRLVKIMDGAATVATFKYDGLNRRIIKTTSLTRDYYYSNKWQVLEERTGLPNANCPERQFVWGLRYTDDLIFRDRETSGSSSSVCLSLSERLYALHDYFHVTTLTNTAGTAVERYGYDAYGQPTVMTGTFGSRTSSLYEWETRYGAYRWDSESGLYHVRHRYLHPKLGRWLTRDPIDYQGGLNLYAYIGDNGITFVDSVGLFGIQVDFGAASYAEIQAEYQKLGITGRFFGYTYDPVIDEKRSRIPPDYPTFTYNKKSKVCYVCKKMDWRFKIKSRYVRTWSRGPWFRVAASGSSAAKRHEQLRIDVHKHYYQIWAIWEGKVNALRASGESYSECLEKIYEMQAQLDAHFAARWGYYSQKINEAQGVISREEAVIEEKAKDHWYFTRVAPVVVPGKDYILEQVVW